MLEIRCNNSGRRPHTHATFDQLAACVGVGADDDPSFDVSLDVTVTRTHRPIERPAAASVAPSSGIVIRRPSDPPSVPQLKLIDNLGGSWRDMKVNGSKGEASTTIDMLKNPATASGFKIPATPPISLDIGKPHPAEEDERWELFPVHRAWLRGEEPYTGPEWEYIEPPPAAPEDPDDETRMVEAALPVVTSKSILEKMAPLLSSIDDGYYAVESLDDRIKFYRLSRPKKGHYRGCLKVQSIHGATLDTDWILYPSGRIAIYRRGVEDDILLILGDHLGCARRYARSKSRCCKCGTNLTDERSRKYGIGPECEKHWPHIIAMVDLELAAEAEAKRGGR